MTHRACLGFEFQARHLKKNTFLQMPGLKFKSLVGSMGQLFKIINMLSKKVPPPFPVKSPEIFCSILVPWQKSQLLLRQALVLKMKIGMWQPRAKLIIFISHNLFFSSSSYQVRFKMFFRSNYFKNWWSEPGQNWRH